MNQADFTAQLDGEGFENLVEVVRAANGMMDTHAHPFQAKALILEGEIRLVVGGKECIYRVGDVFELAKGMEHVEYYGPHGVRYLVGRK